MLSTTTASSQCTSCHLTGENTTMYIAPSLDFHDIMCTISLSLPHCLPVTQVTQASQVGGGKRDQASNALASAPGSDGLGSLCRLFVVCLAVYRLYACVLLSSPQLLLHIVLADEVSTSDECGTSLFLHPPHCCLHHSPQFLRRRKNYASQDNKTLAVVHQALARRQRSNGWVFYPPSTRLIQR